MTDRRIHEDLSLNGPDAPVTGWSKVTVDEARSRARRLARSHRENFSVLTRLVPRDVRDDFAAVYAFCRTADDLGDEIGDPQRALELLGWWRAEIDAAWAGEPRHWVFRALKPTIERFSQLSQALMLHRLYQAPGPHTLHAQKLKLWLPQPYGLLAFVLP